MSFLSPWWLLALLAVATLAAAYLVVQRRRTPVAMRFTNLALLRSLAPRSAGWRRHVTAVIALLALLMLSLGMARPARDVQVPVERATIVLAIDVSLSMLATDVRPDRFTAAKDAAKLFVEQLPRDYNVALVSFAGTATVAVSPTKDHDQVLGAIDGLELGESTAIGEAIFASLQAIESVPGDGATYPPPAQIVLLSDGSTTAGRLDAEGADAAVVAGVPVSTIAFGTQEGLVELQDLLIPVPVDGPALQSVAERTGGGFYEAVTADELKGVYENLGSSLGERTIARDISRGFLGAGLLLALISAALSVIWTSRLP
ncbi:MAG: VWA domain-containing protein [Mycobacteriales bacterium]